jgi:hypothetical protein
LKSTAENLILWEQRIKEKVQSKMTVEEWCKSNGMSKHQYNYWNHRILKKQSVVEEIPFAEITPILSNSNAKRKNYVPSSDFQIIFNDIRVVVPSDFHPEALARLMKVLRTV